MFHRRLNIIFFILLGIQVSIAQVDSAKVTRFELPSQVMLNPNWSPVKPLPFGFASKKTPFKLSYTLDSSQTFINLEYKLGNQVILLPQALPLKEFLKIKLDAEFRKNLSYKYRKNKGIGVTSTGQGLELNIPFRIKSKLFKRMFGGDQVGFKVTGRIGLEMAGELDKYPGAASSAFQQNSVFSPKFRETQQFQVEGHVGKKVTVSVQQNSEATFDFENTLKVKYDGDDDEIVQSVEAGNVSLSLPSTRFVSGGSQHSGLFGLKANFRVGKFKLTTIASLEKGEKKKQTFQGGTEEQSYKLYDYQYLERQFFFVDSFYVDYFNNYDQNMNWVIPYPNYLDEKQITDLEVWISDKNDGEDFRDGIAAINPEDYVGLKSLQGVVQVSGKVETGSFRQLKRYEDYDFDAYRGFFWLTKQRVEDNKTLAIAYRLSGPNSGRGTTMASSLTDSSILILKLIKPKSLNPGHAHCWNLMMKNVYDVGSKIPPDGFDMKVKLYKTGGNEDVQPVEPAKSYNYLLGLDRLDEQGVPTQEGDNKIDLNNGFIFLKKYGKVIFPDLHPFYPGENSKFSGIAEQFRVDMYNINDNTEKNKRSQFVIEYTSKEAKNYYNLGFNILEGSEEVRLNGRKLERNVDYTIDYFSGEVTITNEAALAPDAKVEIDYESASIFQLNKKTFMGMHGLYEFDKNNFIGVAAMFLNKSTIDDKVRLGQEPTKDFIWDIHGQFFQQSRLVTRLLDKLPLISTDKTSTFRLNAEIAQIRPNPNTRNNSRTGDKNGVAYIDDFEGSERSTSLGLAPLIWTPASIPVFFSIPEQGIYQPIDANDYSQMIDYDTSRVHVNWYRVNADVTKIWPNRQVGRTTGNTGQTSVLRIRWINEKNIPAHKNWWGLMRSTYSFPNQQRTKFIEMWVKGDAGNLHIDIGKISEDYYIKGTNRQGLPSFQNLNTEDLNNNGLLEEDEDVGLDGVKGRDEDNVPGDDGEDDYRAYNATDPPYYNVNGTEGNLTSSEEKYPDSEDLDRNGFDVFNEYFEYEVGLDSNAYTGRKYFAGEGYDGWRLIRIPIKDYVRKIGNPDTTFQEIYFVRFWMNNLPEDDQAHYLNIAAFDFVGYEWEELGIAQSDTSQFIKNDSLFLVTVYNTEENSVQLSDSLYEKYTPPPNVEGAYDRVQQIRTKEQSLVLRAIRLEPGQSGAAEKYLMGGQKYDLSQYQKIKQFVHGDWNLPNENSPLLLKMRLGHSDDNYYEIIEPVYPGWNANTLEINLEDLAATKQEQYLLPDSMIGKPVYKRRIPGYEDRYYIAVGEPNINNITYLRYILKNNTELTTNETIENMEVWIDELRASDVVKDPGMAMRVETSVELADLVRYSGIIESKDANFHSLGQNVNASATTTEKLNHSLEIHPEKLLPRKFNLSTLLNIRYSQSKSIPKFFTKTDRLTNYKYTSMVDRFNAILGNKKINEELNSHINYTETMGYTFTFKRQSRPRDPWYVKYTINNFSTSYNFSKSSGYDYNTLDRQSRSQSLKASFRIPFGKNNFIEPFKWTKNIPLLGYILNQHYYYTPKSLQMDLGVNDNYDRRESRIGSSVTENKKLNSSRSIVGTYDLTNQLSFNLNRSYTGDASTSNLLFNDFISKMFSEGYFGTTTRMNQSFGMNYRPRRWFSFFTPSYTFNSSYNYTYVINNNARNVRLDRNYQISGTIKLDKLMELFYKPSQKAKNSGASRRRPSQSRTEKSNNHFGRNPKIDEKNEATEREEVKTPTKLKENIPTVKKQILTEENIPEKKKQSTGEKVNAQPLKKVKKPGKKLPKIPNPLIGIWKLLYMWKDIKLDYGVHDNFNHTNTDRLPDWKFMFGLADNANVGFDTTNNKIAIPRTWQHSEKLNAAVQFSPVSIIQIRLNYNNNSSRNDTRGIVTESEQGSYFFSGDEPDRSNDIFKIIPNWSVTINNLQNYFGLKNYFKLLTVEHVRSGQYSKNFKIRENEKLSDGETYTRQYQPFLRIRGNTKWGVNLSFENQRSLSYAFPSSGNETKQLNNSYTLSFQYSHSGGLILPFFKNKKIKNDVSFNMQIQKTTNKNFSKRVSDLSVNSSDKKFIELDVADNLTVSPGISYRLSKNINGEFYSTYRKTKTKRTEHVHFEMGVRVNIDIR